MFDIHFRKSFLLSKVYSLMAITTINGKRTFQSIINEFYRIKIAQNHNFQHLEEVALSGRGACKLRHRLMFDGVLFILEKISYIF